MTKAKTISKQRHHLDRRAEQMRYLPQASGKPDDLLTTKKVAAWLGVSVQWIELGRGKGNYGPKYQRLGKRMVRYRRDDVLAWLDDRSAEAA